MKIFKITDVIISATLIVLFLVMALAMPGEIIFVGYFVVGGWQLLSIIVHISNKWFTVVKSQRYYYSWFVFVVLACGALGFLIYPLFLVLYFLLFAAPVMAVYYTGLCLYELQLLNDRKLFQLK